MTKARTVTQARKSRRGGRQRQAGKRQPNGQLARPRREEREAAQRAAIVARCIALGWLPHPDGSMMPTADMAQRAAEPHMGCPAGRAIDGHKDRPRLWEAVKRIRAVYAAYWRAIGAPPPYARGMNMGVLPDPWGSEGVEVVRLDTRSEEERIKAATSAMMHMEGVLGATGAIAEVKRVVLSTEEPVRDMGRFLAGLQAVVEDA